MRPALVLILCALPVPVLAEQTEVALYTVLARQGCSVGPHEVADTFAPEGFTPEFVRDTLTGLLIDGTATEDAVGRLSVPPSLCPPDTAAATPKQQFLGEFAANDCALHASDLDAVMGRLGLSRAQLQAIATPLYDAGAIEVRGRRATLSDTLCGAAATN
ncbi:hypothetical protein ILP92_12275 [Maribius pontilimi]|uniref:Uncharacterized protein n=1 Tax=Palleronia pontilimi TaxID=1964209 RepID=A0A934IAK6_9RHOB|nr:hypothetical protein [Palleronia pontilimi]MBJ3763523.1 hypothetical protein [Palleronia pontilimi]